MTYQIIHNMDESGSSGSDQLGKDFVAGLQVALIALPLSIGISLASGFPAASGLLAAIIGGLLVSWLGGGRVAINGPAAGLIVVILFGVEHLGHGDPLKGYQLTLAAIVCAGLIQVALGLVKAGKFAVMFPETVVHGMLSAIGIIIALKQFPILLGTKAQSKYLFELFLEIPSLIVNANRLIALLGVGSLLVLIGWSRSKNKIANLIPAPIIVVGLSILAANFLEMSENHALQFFGKSVDLGPQYLVPMPSQFFQSLGRPDFSALYTFEFISTVVAIALVASIETLLSASAVDKLDPLQRKTDLDRDLVAVGVGTIASGLLGGLPMIAEIVRSSANISAGAKGRFANFSHGVILLVVSLLMTSVVRQIPLAALAALLIYTGYRLSSPKELVKVSKIGMDQLFIYVATIVTVLATDLLVGVSVGITVKMILHVLRGVKLKELIRADISTLVINPNEYLVKVKSSLVFSNLRGVLLSVATLPAPAQINLDLTDSKFIDHTTLERLHHIKNERERTGGKVFIIENIDHVPVSNHIHAARRLRS